MSLFRGAFKPVMYVVIGRAIWAVVGGFVTGFLSGIIPSGGGAAGGAGV